MKIKVLMILAITGLIVGCSSDDSSSSSSVSNPMTNSFGTLSSKLGSMDFSPGGASTSSLKPMTAFGSKWSTDLIFPDVTCSNDCGAVPMITTKDWMGHQIDSNAARDNDSKISVLGRVETAMQIFCVIGVGLGTSSTYPADGVTSVTFNPATKSIAVSQCDFTDASTIPDGTVVGLTVSTPSSTINYDKKVDIDLSNLGSGTQTYYFKATATDINVATTEVNSNGISRTVVFYNATSDILRAEYVSGPDDSSLDDTDVSSDPYSYAEFYRLFFDATNDEGHILHIGGQDSTDVGITFQGTKFSLSGKPNTTGGTFSLSMDSNNVGGSAPYELCVNKETGDMVSGGTDGIRCVASGTALNGFDVTTVAASILDAFFSTYDSADYKTVGDSTVLNFTNGTNVSTSAISTN